MQEIEEDSQTVDCLSPDGKIVALIKIEVFGKRANEQARNSSLIKIEESKAKEFGEARIQIREHGRYRYEIKSEGQNLILRETSEVIPDSNPERGAIEPSDHCGRLTLKWFTKTAGPADCIRGSRSSIAHRRLSQRLPGYAQRDRPKKLGLIGRQQDFHQSQARRVNQGSVPS